MVEVRSGPNCIRALDRIIHGKLGLLLFFVANRRHMARMRNSIITGVLRFRKFEDFSTSSTTRG